MKIKLLGIDLAKNVFQLCALLGKADTHVSQKYGCPDFLGVQTSCPDFSPDFSTHALTVFMGFFAVMNPVANVPTCGARLSMDARSHIHYAQTRTSSLESHPTLGGANA
jgi:hypothetical protein